MLFWTVHAAGEDVTAEEGGAETISVHAEGAVKGMQRDEKAYIEGKG